MTSIYSSSNELNTNIWGALLHFLSQPNPVTIQPNTDPSLVDAVSRISALLDPEIQEKKPIPIRTFLNDLQKLDANQALEKDTLVAMIKAIVNKIMSGLLSKSMLTALLGLIGHLIHLDSGALDDLIPSIKQAMKKAVKLIVRQLIQNPKKAQYAHQMLKLIGSILSQLGLPKQTPEKLIQSVALDLGINADDIQNLLTNPVTPSETTLPQDPLSTINISVDALWNGTDKVLDLVIPNAHAIASVGIKKFEEELGSILDVLQ